MTTLHPLPTGGGSMDSHGRPTWSQRVLVRRVLIPELDDYLRPQEAQERWRRAGRPMTYEEGS